jgi:hypothetical protein
MRDKIYHGTNGVKLNNAIVHSVRTQLQRSAIEWAQELGVHINTIYKIRRGVVWKNL